MLHKHWLGRLWLGMLLAVWGGQTSIPRLHANDKMTLRLVYTSDTIGYVDACG